MERGSIYREIDHHPLLLRFLFYPRRWEQPPPPGAEDLLIPVEEGVAVGCRLYEGEAGRAWILLFHGNGEIAADYDEIAPLYHRIGINLAVADYRGYGKSGGRPSFASMVEDAAAIYEAIRDRLEERKREEKLFVMGRSLGSVSALELAARYAEMIPGLSIESGFISVGKLIRHLGLPAAGLDLAGLDKECGRLAAGIRIPALIIHGEADSLVPYAQAEELYRSLGSTAKRLLPIPGAEHNDIMLVGGERYFGAMAGFVEAPGRFAAGA